MRDALTKAMLRTNCCGIYIGCMTIPAIAAIVATSAVAVKVLS